MSGIVVKIKKKLYRFDSNLHFKNRASKLAYPPLALFVEPTNRCNLKCPMCPQSAGLEREYGFMDMDLYRKIVDDARESGIYTISLFMAGEPLLHKGIVEMVKITSDAGLEARLHTNATALTENISRELIDANLSEISFSFDGEDRETYKAMRKGADYEKVLSNIRTFLKCKKELGAKAPFTIIQVIKEYTEGGGKPKVSNKFRSLFEGLPVDQFKAIQLHSYAGLLKDNENFKHFPYTLEFTPCQQIWRRFVIGWDGRAIACCIDMEGYNEVGDVKKESLLEIWNSERFVRLREKLVNKDYKDLEACRDCDFLWREYREKKDNILKRLGKKAIWSLRKSKNDGSH